MSSAPEVYLFPDAEQFVQKQNNLSAVSGRPSPEDVAAQEALERGYADGFARGRAEAEQAFKSMLDTAGQEGFAHGHQEGLQRVAHAAEALQQALADLVHCRRELIAEAESFCVELALAMMARLVEADQVRTDFIRRTIKDALGVLTPGGRPKICMHPASLKLAAGFPELPVQPDDSLSPGAVRVEAGRFVIESSLDQAFEQIRTAVLETRTRRTLIES